MGSPSRTSIVTETAILGFFGDYRWLSNFHLNPLTFDGITYTCAEGAYMAQKTTSLEQRKLIATMNPGEAKRYGRTIILRDNWDILKLGYMYEIQKEKYNDPYLGNLLFLTGDKYLEETNDWGDCFWGVCKGKGTNMLGHLIMAVRNP